ncbi:MAG: tetratricopeptide repeat protein, partial [Bryobacteraceae bacterium]|nr:tetratricopeptide repeat protein [Bryobacteraceae bacterium]
MNFSPGILALALGAQSFGQGFDLREAARLDSQGKCAESELHYQRALAAGKPSPSLLNNAGNHYLLCKQPEKARGFFEQLVGTNPSHPNANLQLARLPGTPPIKALEYLARVRAGGDPATLFTLGMEYGRLGRFDRAEEALHQASIVRPGDFEILYQLGRAAARAGHLERARTTLEAALKIRPEDPGALTELGLAHAGAKDFTRAVYLLAQAHQKAPGHPGILLALARAAEDAGYYGDAAIAYDRYLKLQPTDETARRDRARVLGLTGTRLEEGLKEMEAYIARHPDDPAGHFNLAQFSWRTKPEQSLEQLATALRLDPKFAPAHVARAWLLHRLGRDEEAVLHLNSALAVTPHDVRALDLLGVAYLSLDRARDAEPVLRRAVQLAPKDPETLLHLGRALMALGRETEAQNFLDRYQQERPKRQRDPRREPGMIESATLSAGQRRLREIERFGAIARARPDDPLLQMHLATLL